MPANSLSNLKPERILVITQRYLGDTLLITALLHSLKTAYQNARIDVLLPQANTAVLEGNPDIHQLLTFPQPATLPGFIRLLSSIYRRYDLSISLQTSDRTTLCAIAAGRLSLGLVDTESKKNWWKKKLLSGFLIFENQHAVLENLRFCALLGIEPCYTLIAPHAAKPLTSLPAQPYAVLHIMPQWRYKQWHIQGWLDVIDFLARQGLKIVLSGSKQSAELAYLASVIAASPHDIINLAGQLSLAELSETIAHARVFIGPDTGITHLAAATGVAVIAIFGPTDPQKWAPWPRGYQAALAPFASRGCQSVNNVTLIQDATERACLPCQGEGCDRHRESHSACLDQLSSDQVIGALQQILHASGH